MNSFRNGFDITPARCSCVDTEMDAVDEVDEVDEAEGVHLVHLVHFVHLVHDATP